MVLALSNGHALTFEQIQKALFIVQHQMPEGVKNRPDFEFVPFHYGPHAPGILDIANHLAHEKLAQILPGRDGDRTYSVTPSGTELAAAMHYDLGRDVIQYIGRVVAWVRATPIENVFREIVKQYPQYELQSAYRKAA